MSYMQNVQAVVVLYGSSYAVKCRTRRWLWWLWTPWLDVLGYGALRFTGTLVQAADIADMARHNGITTSQIGYGEDYWLACRVIATRK